jgi:tRNA 2-thiouridine synthesizing protein E
VLAELRALRGEVAALRAEGAARRELWDEAMPIAKLALDRAVAELEALERRGVLAFGRALLGVGGRVVDAFGPDDVRALGDAVVGILNTVRAWTQPGVMTLAQVAGAAVEAVRPDDKLGVWGALAASRDDDVQRGAALAVAVLRRVGRAARAGASAAGGGARPAGWARLQARLGPSGVAAARPAATATAGEAAAPASPRSATAPAAAARPGAASAPPAASTRLGALPPPAGFEALPWDADGHLADPDAWTEALCAALAEQHGLALEAPCRAVVAAARAHHAETGAVPNVRKLTLVAGISTRELYALFPERPGSTVARVAGLSKPKGCV